MNWYLDVLQKKYAQFEGRAHRTEFWMFFLFNLIAAIAIGIIDGITGIGFLGAIYALGTLIPNIALGARRLHDTNRSGWWQLIALIPLLGILILLVFFCLSSNEGDNNYGPPQPPAQPD